MAALWADQRPLRRIGSGRDGEPRPGFPAPQVVDAVVQLTAQVVEGIVEIATATPLTAGMST